MAHWITQPLYHDNDSGWQESVLRRYSSMYHEAVMTRQAPIVFENIPQMLLMVEDLHEDLDQDTLHTASGKKQAHDRLNDIQKHLNDAADKRCPLQLRIEHFDCVGGVVWDLMREEHVMEYNARIPKLFDFWKLSNGI